ncbi:histidine phosphatase superfamily [Aspergillus coremiiformis]|uniref:3-phytase n=1 Tax=Aspergillus coremiiformis TaxID=138285 RepID=A0A5N6ZEC1_9EURO|nr:histidine phosphatase superfamily [Aspergillus coremiiformis]
MQQFWQSTAVLLAFQAVIGEAAPTSSSSAAVSGPTGATYPSGFDISTSWANLSPYKDVSGFKVSKGVPRGCELSQVHVLHRHGQRYPTSWWLDGGAIEDFAQKLKNYTKRHENATVGHGPLSFLNQWEYLLGEDLLLVSGAATEVTSGANIWSKYGRALYRAPVGVSSYDASLNIYPNGTERSKPIFRTTDQARILESARWWLSGFFGNNGTNSSSSHYDLVITHEGSKFNNTLASDSSCPGDQGEGDDAGEAFIPSLTKNALKRLSIFVPPNFNLTANDVVGMLSLCPYETAALGSSSFCSLFTEQEWRDFEYFIDIQFYGNYGFGSPTGRAQGIGYVLELAARLEGNRIATSDTSINATIDSNPATFPLNQPLYMDMSHDDVISAVLTALGLEYFNHGSKGLPGNVDHAVPRTFQLNELTPFGAHLISEIWTCPKGTNFHKLDAVQYKNPDLSSTPHTTDLIRFVLNGAPVSQKGLDGCESSINGFCAVKDFLKGVPKLKEKAAYQYACFGNYTAGHQVGDGRPE